MGDYSSLTPGAFVRHHILVLCFAALAVPTASSAQTPHPTWPPLNAKAAAVLYTPTELYRAPPRMLSLADTVARNIKPTYWREGGLVGAVSVGAFMAYFVHALCQLDDSIRGSCAETLVRGGLFGGLVGFGIGAMVGGQFPKHPRNPGTAHAGSSVQTGT